MPERFETRITPGIASIKNIVQPGFLTAMVMALVIAIGMFVEIRLTTLRGLNSRWCDGYLGGSSPIQQFV